MCDAERWSYSSNNRFSLSPLPATSHAPFLLVPIVTRCGASDWLRVNFLKMHYVHY